jgi:putative membrane protein
VGLLLRGSDIGWGWMMSMMVFMVLFWGAVIFGIVWLIRSSVDHRPEHRTESPIDILERRFAEGAIPVEDYRARRDVLVKGATGSNGAGVQEPLTAPQPPEGRQR